MNLTTRSFLLISLFCCPLNAETTGTAPGTAHGAVGGAAATLPKEPVKPPAYSPHWRPGVRVAPLSPYLAAESPIPSPYLAANEVCYVGVTGSGKASAPFHATVGKKQERFVIPITEKPEKILEPGDVMIYVRPTPVGSNRLYDHVTRGAWHVAMVIKKDGKLSHLDSPEGMSGDKFNDGVYHIVRLRKYPREVTSEKELAAWKADPEKKKLLDAWEARRTETLKNVARYAAAIKAAGYTYDSERVTEISDKEKRAALKKLIDEKKTPRTCLYCSELPATVFALAGIEPPKSNSLLESFERVEKTVLPGILASSPGADAGAKLKNAVYRIFQDEGVLRELGASAEEMNAYRKDGTLPANVKHTADQLLKLLKLPPETRRLAMMADGMFSKSKGELVSPADWMDAMYGKESDFDYVGTFTGKYCGEEGGGADFAGYSPSRGAGAALMGTGIPDSVLAADPQHLRSFTLHSQEISSLRVSPDGRFALTSSQDGKVKVLNLLTGAEKNVPNEGSAENAMFSPDGKLVATMADRTVRIVTLATGTEKKFELKGAVRSIQFSPDGKSILLAGNDGAKEVELATEKEKIFEKELIVNRAEYSSDGKFVSVAYFDKLAKVVELKTGKEVKISQTDLVRQATFSPDGKLLLTADNYNEVQWHDLARGTRKTLSGQASLAPFSPDGKFVVTTNGNAVQLHDLAAGTTKKFEHSEPSGATFSPDGKRVLTTWPDGTLAVLEIATGTTLKIRAADARGGIFSPDGKLILSARPSGALLLHSTQPATLDYLRKELRAYDATLFTDANRGDQTLRDTALALFFAKAKAKGMTFAQAKKITREEVSTLSYREDAAHLGGVLKAVWPTGE